MRIARAVLGFGLIAVLASPAAGQTTPPPVWTALEMGEWTVSGGASGDQWHYTPPVRITFDTAFSSPPAVRLAMGRVEDESRRSGSFYGAFASAVTTTGFDLTVRYAYSNSFSGRVDWIAIGEKAAVPPPQRVRTGMVTMPSALRPTGDSWQLVSRTHVSFDSTFSSPPSLWLGLKSIEDYLYLNRIGTYYEIRPAAVTATGFDLEVYGKHAESFSTARIDWIAAGPSVAPVNPPSVQSGEHLLPPATRPTGDQWTLVEQTHIAFARPFVSVPAVQVTAHATDQWTRKPGSFRWLAPINVTPSGFDLQVYAAYTSSYNMDRFDWIAVEDQTVPWPIIDATKAASGPGADGIYTEGELVTYSVVLTNVGAAPQPDNPEHELVDPLPPGLSVVSATASAGVTGVSGGTVSWDGAIPAGESVTVTIEAEINAGTTGTTLSNQAAADYDADGNGTNETEALSNVVSIRVQRKHPLEVVLAGASGSVVSTPPGIDCGTTCSASFVEGTLLTLTATPGPGAVFSGWSGACAGADASCEITMDTAKQVAATFVTRTAPLTALETGSRTISGGASGDQWHYLPDVHIPFSTPYSSQPAVRLAIGRVEDGSRVPGSFYGAYAVNVTTTGFDLRVRYAYSNSFSGRVDWIATGEKPGAGSPQRVRAGRITVTPAASTGDSWQLVSRTHVTFNGPFSSAPSVWLGLRGIDDRLNRNGTYYELQAAAITGSGFDLEVYANHATVFSAAWIDWIAVGASPTPAEPPSVQSGEHSMPASVRPAASRWSEVYKAHIDFDWPFAVAPAVAVTGRLTDHVTGRQNGNFRYVEPSNITTTGFDLVVYAADSDSYNMDRFDWIAVEGVAHQKTMPLFAVGAFAAGRDVPEAAAHEGNVFLVVPSYHEDAEAVALALEASDKQAILSAHHVFGGPRDQWEAGWAQTLQWAAPLTSRGLVAAIYVVDEPLANGIPAAQRDEAIAIVRAAGYKTMIAEYVGNARNDVTGPQQVDYYGVTAYDPPLSQAQALTEYRNHPQWNFVVGQGFDLQAPNGTPQQQFAAWIDMARDTRRAGVVFWVWRWPGQTGIGDDPDYLAAYDDQVRARPMPGFAAGAFTPSIDVPEAAAHGGNLVLVVPSYRDDPEAVALALEAGNKRAILSAHHVFGGPPDQWQAGWAQTLSWAAPLTSRGLVAAIYVVDEPLHNGIPVARRDEAIAFVRASGYKTMIAEWIDSARNDTTGPQRVDYYGVSAYDFGSFGPTLPQALAEYANHPQWNFVVGQGFNLQSRNGSPHQQFTAWVNMARNTRKAGVVFWVWRWSQQVGIGDNAEYLAAYDAAMR